MEKTKILLISYEGRFHEMYAPGSEYCQKLTEAFPQCEFRFRERFKHTMEDMLWADVVSGNPPPAQLSAAPNIRWFHMQSAGVDGYADRSIYANPDIILTRTADVFGQAIAEHGIGFMLALCRCMPLYFRRQGEHKWFRDEREKYELSGSNVLLLGAGSLAKEFITRLSGFGCKISALRRSGKPTDGCVHTYLPEELNIALSQADFVINTLPMTNYTKNIMGETEFAAMRPSAFYINVGRGGTTDTDALIRALEKGIIAGAGLDVTDPEPLPASSPLWDMDNVIITPHSSGFSEVTNRRRHDVFCRLINEYLNGEPLEYQVNFDLGY